MKERILFVGIGQCGSNIAQEFEKKGYFAMYINTSNADLEAVEGKSKFHIPAAFGCNKDRRKAKGYAKDYYATIIDVIDSKYPRQDIVYFIFSLGGGTGSGISPVMLDVISRKNRDKTYGGAIILPHRKESLKTLNNALESYKEISNIQNLKNLFVLDNNRTRKFNVNKMFVDQFDRMINITNADKRGIIDQAELETIIKCPGTISISIWSNKLEYSQIPFADNEYGCRYLAYSVGNANELDTDIVENKLGIPEDTFIGYNNNSENFVISAGMPFPRYRIERYLQEVKEKAYSRKSNDFNRGFDYIVPNQLDQNTSEIQKEEKKTISFEDVFSKYL